ncbi:MAG: CDGSH iron-sulfur domain-containing protein [Pseudomonadales bacterium]|nr:CDGSH iron-sulfur domain-containing protein [Pseudomonadales bacterium]
MSDNDKAIVADGSPAKVSLQAGEQYSFCTCGRSAAQPFCDGSHKTTSLKPLRFTAEKTEDAWLCCCKQTGKAPFCDGSHKELYADQIGKAL